MDEQEKETSVIGHSDSVSLYLKTNKSVLWTCILHEIKFEDAAIITA